MRASESSFQNLNRHIDAVSANGWLSTVVYKSRAVAPLEEIDLQRLVDAAQRRNQAEGLTGLVVYDEGRFLQWLEGPADSLSRVMRSINCDARHTDIEVLGNQKTPTRMFGHWGLHLAKKRTSVAHVSRAGFDAPSELIESLFKDSNTAPSLLAKVGAAIVRPSQFVRGFSSGGGEIGVIEPQSMLLARLLIAIDPGPAFSFIEAQAERVDDPSCLFKDIFEPTARSLGDMWNADQCNEFEVTLGLCNLQNAMRKTCAKHMAHRLSRDFSSKVLVMPQPGEPHMLAATMHAEVLWHAGWQTRCEFPATDRALQNLVSSEWFDALDLSLSESLSRESKLDSMIRSISATREAALNPNLVISVGGRIFSERKCTAARVGADVGGYSTFDISGQLETAIRYKSELYQSRRTSIRMN